MSDFYPRMMVWKSRGMLGVQQANCLKRTGLFNRDSDTDNGIRVVGSRTRSLVYIWAALMLSRLATGGDWTLLSFLEAGKGVRGPARGLVRNSAGAEFQTKVEVLLETIDVLRGCVYFFPLGVLSGFLGRAKLFSRATVWVLIWVLCGGSIQGSSISSFKLGLLLSRFP